MAHAHFFQVNLKGSISIVGNGPEDHSPVGWDWNGSRPEVTDVTIGGKLC